MSPRHTRTSGWGVIRLPHARRLDDDIDHALAQIRTDTTMSYSRFGCDGSDVYTFPSDRGLECCGCPLLTDLRSFATRDLDAFAEHLAEHRAAGHTVPDAVMTEIRADLPWLVSDDLIDRPTPAPGENQR